MNPTPSPNETPNRSHLISSRLDEMTAHERVIESLRTLDLTTREVWQICGEELGYTRFETRRLLGELGLILTSEQLASADTAVQAKIEKLRNWRALQARAGGIAAYRVLTNRALLAIAQGEIRQREDLRRIKGIGVKTIETYGSALLDLLRS